jgi:hypothetical protein
MSLSGTLGRVRNFSCGFYATWYEKPFAAQVKYAEKKGRPQQSRPFSVNMGEKY